jgi:hypothetical protein
MKIASYLYSEEVERYFKDFKKFITVLSDILDINLFKKFEMASVVDLEQLKTGL